IELAAPAFVATATCGFKAGEEPPTVGKAWQPEQLSRLKRGPRPLPGASVPETESTSWNVVFPLLNAASSPGVRLLSGSPVPREAEALIGPGSRWARALPEKRKNADEMAAFKHVDWPKRKGSIRTNPPLQNERLLSRIPRPTEHTKSLHL